MNPLGFCLLNSSYEIICELLRALKYVNWLNMLTSIVYRQTHISLGKFVMVQILSCYEMILMITKISTCGSRIANWIPVPNI